MLAEPKVFVEPEGLVYRTDFLTEDEECDLLHVLEGMKFQEVRMRGQTARRTVLHFGYDYDYESWRLLPTEPLPSALAWLRKRAGELAGVPHAELAQVLVTKYPPGAGIGWHRDAPMFGAKVVGVSLGSPCRMRFRRKAGGVRRVFELELTPRSAYILSGAARSAWQHHIPAVKTLRYSITFRMLRNPDRFKDSPPVARTSSGSK
ncbi:MAG: alpha-ketoglutarate-dependent dioxygenase AlkB [Actinomycetota bacterium]|nr:alpha-ketoglutarate-dependent dioxygenase AlkB [Actinomycetota bacterium]